MLRASLVAVTLGARDRANLYEAGFANFHLHPPTEVHFNSGERAPLLIVGAEKDNTVPASLSKKRHEKYNKSSARTNYVEFRAARTS